MRIVDEYSVSRHEHIPSLELDKEITLCIYNKDNLDGNFSDRIVTLIREDS